MCDIYIYTYILYINIYILYLLFIRNPSFHKKRDELIRFSGKPNRYTKCCTIVIKKRRVE